MKIKITLFVLGKEFSAVADTIAEAYEYVKAIVELYSEAFPDRDETLSECMEILSAMRSGEGCTKRKNCWFMIERINDEEMRA